MSLSEPKRDDAPAAMTTQPTLPGSQGMANGVACRVDTAHEVGVVGAASDVSTARLASKLAWAAARTSAS